MAHHLILSVYLQIQYQMKSQTKTQQPQLKSQPPKKPPLQPKEASKPWNADNYVDENVSIQEVREVKAAFDIFDSDGSGAVDLADLKQAFISLGLGHHNKLVYNVMQAIDRDHPNGLDFNGFLKLALGKLGESNSKKQIKAVFGCFDQHHTGKINIQQFKEATAELGQFLSDDEIDKIFSKTDTDGDGYVTAEDFYNIMTQKSSR